MAPNLGLVEEAALEDSGLLLGGDLDVLGGEEEDSLRDPLIERYSEDAHVGDPQFRSHIEQGVCTGLRTMTSVRVPFLS